MATLCERAHNLAADIPDFEAAARDLETWTFANGVWSHDEKPITYATAQALINGEGFDPYDIEVHEHWIVSEALAAKLTAMGQKVDTDFAGLCVWARTLKGSLEVDPS